MFVKLFHSVEMTTLEERMCAERRRLVCEMEERDARRKEEVEKIKEEADIVRKSAEDRARQAVNSKVCLQEEVAELHTTLCTERTQADDGMRLLRQTLKKEHEVRKHSLLTFFVQNFSCFSVFLMDFFLTDRDQR